MGNQLPSKAGTPPTSSIPGLGPTLPRESRDWLPSKLDSLADETLEAYLANLHLSWKTTLENLAPMIVRDLASEPGPDEISIQRPYGMAFRVKRIILSSEREVAHVNM
jgi:hypothetical protein